MIVIIADEGKVKKGWELYQTLREQKIDAKYLSVSNMHIQPCFGCQGCLYKTYGKCVVRDDMDQIQPLLMQAEVIVFTSPTLWGGFSYPVKKVIDKLILLSNGFYRVRGGRLTKQGNERMRKIVGLGSGEADTKEARDFAGYIKAVGQVIGVDYLAKTGTIFTDGDEIQNLIEEVSYS